MKKTRRISAALVLTLLAFALPALAAPPPCEINCSCTSLCNKICSFGSYISSCGGFGLCRGQCLAGVPQAEDGGVTLESILAAPAQETTCAAAASISAAE